MATRVLFSFSFFPLAAIIFIKTVWFNPWKYDKKEDLWKALLQNILFQIIESKPEQKVLNAAGNLVKKVSWSFLKKSVSTLTNGIISVDNIEDIKNLLLKEDEAYHKYVNQFEQDFSDIVNDYVGEGKLVVFVDEIDVRQKV